MTRKLLQVCGFVLQLDSYIKNKQPKNKKYK